MPTVKELLVCRASRGIDSAYVEHVILFDFPRDPSEYVRRVGRTARGATGQGTVSIIVMGRQVSDPCGNVCQVPRGHKCIL